MPKIDNIHFEYKKIGRGEVNIVFLSGFRMKFDNRNKVYPEIVADHSILLFNRHGVGSSAKATMEQVGHTVVDEIHMLISKLNMNLPYLLVAHSLGGIFANLYARIYSNDISGLVLVDAPHPLKIAE